MWHCLRSYIKNSCFGSHQGLQTPRNNKSTRPKRPRAFICFSVFGTPDETLALVVDILLLTLYKNLTTSKRNYCWGLQSFLPRVMLHEVVDYSTYHWWRQMVKSYSSFVQTYACSLDALQMRTSVIASLFVANHCRHKANFL